MTPDTSAEALLKLADKLNPEPRAYSYGGGDLKLIAETLRALAAERAATPADVVERVAGAISLALAESKAPNGIPLNEYIEILGNRDEVERWGIIWPKSPVDRWGFIRDDQLEIIGKTISAAALSAIRPGDEIPAGVVVPKDAEPDWWYCDIDPDECGDSAYDAMFQHRPRLTPVELSTSYIGPKYWGVMCPPMPDADDDGDTAHTFDTREEAEAFIEGWHADFLQAERRAALSATKGGEQ